ncbi:MAG: alkaline phosphatase family protein [Verrucomicrobia bacterium]|nr:alkaline phosphatase family protein [Verrucomicrobiota bacterium]
MITSRDLSPYFPSGLMAAMSEGRTFHFYHWDAVAGDRLTVAPDARPVVHWIWSGAVTTQSARITALLGHMEDVVLLVSAEDDFNPAVRIAPTRWIPESRGWIAHFDVPELSAGTTYHYVIERKGRVIWQHAGTFRTFPKGASHLRIAMGSCAATGSNHPVFSTIMQLQPDFFLHLGDLHYEDIAVNEVQLFKDAYHAVLTAPRQAELYRSTPIAYIWDDHDYGPNNSDGSSPSRMAALKSYRAAVPHYPLVSDEEDGSIQQAFSFGRVRIIMTDGRSMRSARSVADGPERTQLGARQLAWLKRELSAAARDYALIVWANTVPWIGEEPNYDRWSGFQYERRAIAGFLEREGIHNVVMVSGDAHMVAIDDGTNNRYGPSGEPLFPILHAAALDRRGSVKGGPYSHGAFPGPGQFGLLEVEDDGGSTIRVTLKGMNHWGEVLVEHSFERAVFPQ